MVANYSIRFRSPFSIQSPLYFMVWILNKHTNSLWEFLVKAIKVRKCSLTFDIKITEKLRYLQLDIFMGGRAPVNPRQCQWALSENIWKFHKNCIPSSSTCQWAPTISWTVSNDFIKRWNMLCLKGKKLRFILFILVVSWGRVCHGNLCFYVYRKFF